MNVSVHRLKRAFTVPTSTSLAIEKGKSVACLLRRIVQILDPDSLEVVERVPDVCLRVKVAQTGARLAIERFCSVEVGVQVSRLLVDDI